MAGPDITPPIDAVTLARNEKARDLNNMRSQLEHMVDPTLALMTDIRGILFARYRLWAADDKRHEEAERLLNKIKLVVEESRDYDVTVTLPKIKSLHDELEQL